ncbi:MAG: hypothetical protein OXF79_09575 [Chloroflexi bacterium]|nr:hypothetical protein [Chloroflexota bacterium]
MVKVALTFEGDADDVILAMRQLAAGDASAASPIVNNTETSVATALANASDEASSIALADVPEGRWTIEHVRAFWGFLADDAREIYQRVAQSAGYVLSRQALLEEMHLTVRQLSGRLSSQGHAVRRIRRVHNVSLPHPMSFDSQADEYRMLPDVADAIVRLNL